MAAACAQAVASGVATYPELAAELRDLTARCRTAFLAAATEPKLGDRKDLLARAAAREVPVPPEAAPPAPGVPGAARRAASKAPHVMRKNMTGVLRETLESHPDCVYIGEDVEHGGYYMVTDGLAKAFPQRVRDFPPDETSLVGMVALPLTGDLGWWSHSSCTGHWLCPDRAAADPGDSVRQVSRLRIRHVQ